jgi:hypothetical protein
VCDAHGSIVLHAKGRADLVRPEATPEPAGHAAVAVMTEAA